MINNNTLCILGVLLECKGSWFPKAEPQPLHPMKGKACVPLLGLTGRIVSRQISLSYLDPSVSPDSSPSKSLRLYAPPPWSLPSPPALGSEHFDADEFLRYDLALPRWRVILHKPVQAACRASGSHRTCPESPCLRDGRVGLDVEGLGTPLVASYQGIQSLLVIAYGDDGACDVPWVAWGSWGFLPYAGHRMAVDTGMDNWVGGERLAPWRP